MKRLYSFLPRFLNAAFGTFLLLLLSFAGFSQSPCFSFRMPTLSGALGDTVLVPVSVRDFQDILTFQFILSWSEDDLELLPPLALGANPLGLSSANYNASQPGELRFAFFDQNALGVTLPDNTVLFTLRFQVKTAQSEFITIRNQQGQTAFPWEVVAGSVQLSTALVAGGVYANMPLPSNPPVIDEICSGATSGNCLNNVGTISTTISGGSGSFAFLWHGPNGLALTTQNLTNLPGGMYYLTVTDQTTGVVAFADVYVASGGWPFSIAGEVQNTSCAGDDGCIQITPTTNQWPVTYAWSAPGLTGQNICSLTPGMYTVTATDAGNCTSVQSFEVLFENELKVGIQTSPANCTNGQLGSIVAVPKNGVWPYNYLWSNNVNAQINSGLTTGQYTVTVTDAQGCTGVGEVEIGDAGVSDWDLVLFTDCPGGNAGNLLLYSGNPTAPAYPVAVEWSNGTTVVVPAPDDTLALLEMAPPGVYSALVTDSLGCSVFLESALSCFGSTQQDSALLVWPGDADNNNAVNHYDLLYLGLAYGATGTPRAGATNDWSGQPADDWSQNMPGHVVNFKNMDTNGDGIVNAADTVAIAANWGRVVDPLADNPFAAPDAVPGMGGPAPSMTLAADTLFAGQTTYIPVILGTSDVPVDSLHGLAFSLAYNPKVLIPKYFEPASSWFGDPDNGLICLQRHFAGQNRIDVALSRTDGLPAGGFGLIGRMFIIIEDDIFFRKKDLGEPESEGEGTVTTRVFFRNVRLLTASNSSVVSPPAESKVTVAQTVGTAQPEQPGISISVWPNPASQTVRIAGSPENPLRALRISDLSGRLLYHSTNLDSPFLTLPIHHWAPGVYLIQAQTDSGLKNQLFIVEN